MMNECCFIPGNAQITQSNNPKISWRVVCAYCGELLHVQRRDQHE